MNLLRCSHLLSKNTMILSNIKVLGTNSTNLVDYTMTRNLASQNQKGFLGGIIDNLKDEFNKNKELKESVKKFREEAKKLEESDALKEARNKYKTFGGDAEKSSKVLRDKFESLGEAVKDSEFTKKASESYTEIYKEAQKAAENIQKTAGDISQTSAYKKVSENVQNVGKAVDNVTQLSDVKPYKKPVVLRRREEVDPNLKAKVYEENTEDSGMVLHKDAKWFQAFQNFKDNNQYVNKLFDYKTQYDESDNPIVRTARGLTERLGSMFGGIFKSTEMSEVLTEIVKVEPTFSLDEFLKRVQYDIVPNVMEALSQGEMEILKDWCTETAFNMLTHPIEQCKQLKFNYHNEVLDISHLDIAATKIMDFGEQPSPVLIVTFTAQQIIYVTDASGKVVEGEKDKIKRVSHVWALCRDQSIHDPNAAWRVMECAMHATEQFV